MIRKQSSMKAAARILASPPETVKQTPIDLIRHLVAPVLAFFLFSAAFEEIYLTSSRSPLALRLAMTDYTGQHPKGPDPSTLDGAPEGRKSLSTTASRKSIEHVKCKHES